MNAFACIRKHSIVSAIAILAIGVGIAALVFQAGGAASTLRDAQTALDKQRYGAALDLAREVLETEPDSAAALCVASS